MKFAEFEKHAAASLVTSQSDDGSWGNDQSATCAAMEALLEISNGPDPLCSRSWLHKHTHPSARRIDWLMLSYGIPEGKDFNVYNALASVTKGFSSFRVHRTNEAFNPWLAAKRLHLLTVTDPDFWLYVGEHKELQNYKTEEPWLLGQIGLTLCHFDWPYEPGPDAARFEARRNIADLAVRLNGLSKDKRWVSSTTGPEECTAIVLRFLFHSCVLELFRGLKLDLNNIASKVVCAEWLLGQQHNSGLWADSAHTTSHAVRALAAVATNEMVNDDIRAACKNAILRAVKVLISKDVVMHWERLQDYRQIDILCTLSWLSKTHVVDRAVFESADLYASAVRPRTFISYGGCDSDFALRLARDLEDKGVHVWFADWDIDFGDSIVQEIEKGLESTQRFVVILSPDSIKRPWVRQELDVAFHQALDGPGKEIVPIMLKKCSPPAFVATRKWMDFTDEGGYSVAVADLARRLIGKPKPRR
jgi:hypothetical protein